jgi:hypothetical protein
MSGPESLFLINPRRRKRRKGRMPAGLARYWAARRGGKKRHRARAVMANPRRRRRKHHRRAILANPRRRRRRAVYSNPRRRRSRAVYRNPRRRRHRHHNPFSARGIMKNLKPVAFGVIGAIAADVAIGFATPYLPASLTGNAYIPLLLQGAAAFGVGMLIGKFMSRQDGQYATVGALTVVAATNVIPLLSSALPSLPGLSGLRDYVPFQRGMGAYMVNPGMGRPGMGRLGFVSPAPVVQGSGMRMGRLGAYMRNPVSGMADLSGGSGFNGLNDGM